MSKHVVKTLAEVLCFARRLGCGLLPGVVGYAPDGGYYPSFIEKGIRFGIGFGVGDQISLADLSGRAVFTGRVRPKQQTSYGLGNGKGSGKDRS